MEKAETLVKLFVEAGYKKIHLDTSMRVADDPTDKPTKDEDYLRGDANCDKEASPGCSLYS